MTPSQPTPAPRVLILAGPNGSGKTTFAREFLTAEGNCPTFLNADLIAAGLSPFEPEKANITAMRLMAERIRECVDQRVDFSVESTLAGRTYANLIRENLCQSDPRMEAGWLRRQDRVPAAGFSRHGYRPRAASRSHGRPQHP